MVIAVTALAWLIFGLWVFLVARDVIRTRRALSTPVSTGWIIVAFLGLFGTLAWVIYRRNLLQKETTAQA